LQVVAHREKIAARGNGGSSRFCGGSGGQGDKLFAALGSRLLNLTELREQLLALKFDSISFNLSKFNHQINERFGPRVERFGCEFIAARISCFWRERVEPVNKLIFNENIPLLFFGHVMVPP